MGVPPLSVSGDIVTDDNLKAVTFNNYFRSVFSDVITCDYDHSEVTVNPVVRMSEIYFDVHGIFKLLTKIKQGSVYGPDDIPNTVLKSCADVISRYLTIIFTVSLETGVLPHGWKTANVVPIHKSGRKNLVVNYRPISLTSESCKVMEHVICTSLMSHLAQINFFYSTSAWLPFWFILHYSVN